MFFEHKYKRELDVYNTLGAVLVCVAIIGLSVFACAPFTRSSWYLTRAMHAYEDGDLELGDKLFAEAEKRRHSTEGGTRLLTHIEVWRRYHEGQPKTFNVEILRLPLTHPKLIDDARFEGRPFAFLRDPEVPESLEPVNEGD
jgi:hypothetical protein